MRRTGLVALAAYIGCVFGANYFIQHVGTQPFPGGPHTIPVGFGYRAPSGVLWVGLAFTMRDLVQLTLGRGAVVVAIVIGAALSYLVAPSLAWASGVAFLLSEAADFAVYTPLAQRSQAVRVERTYHGVYGVAAAKGIDVSALPGAVTERRTLVVDQRWWLARVAASNVVGTLVDTFLFLWLAFHSIQFWQGQVIGKLWMTVLAVMVLYPVRRQRAVLARHP